MQNLEVKLVIGLCAYLCVLFQDTSYDMLSLGQNEKIQGMVQTYNTKNEVVKFSDFVIKVAKN